METYDVACLEHQGQTLALIILTSRPTEERWAQLQACAAKAGIDGAVVAVWDQFGRINALAPERWQQFIQELNWDFIRGKVDKTITCRKKRSA